MGISGSEMERENALLKRQALLADNSNRQRLEAYEKVFAERQALKLAVQALTEACNEKDEKIRKAAKGAELNRLR